MDLGVSIWIVAILIALLIVVLWGILFAFLAFGTWFIARSKIPDETEPPKQDW